MVKTIYPESFSAISDVEDFQDYLKQYCGFDKHDIFTVMDMYDDYLQASEMRELADTYQDEMYMTKEHFQHLCSDVLDELDTLKEYTFEKTLTVKKKDEMREIINHIINMVDDNF